MVLRLGEREDRHEGPQGFYSVKVFARGFDGKLYTPTPRVSRSATPGVRSPRRAQGDRIVDFNAGPEPVEDGP